MAKFRLIILATTTAGRQINRTSKTISGKGGKLIEARVGNRKVKLRVDWEPTSGSNGDGVFQVQSGSGKSGYRVNEHIDIKNIYNKTQYGIGLTLMIT